jgi:hypothetical protein
MQRGETDTYRQTKADTHTERGGDKGRQRYT